MTNVVDVALALMRMALALLDQEDEMLAARRLQQAIDTIGGTGRFAGRSDPD